MHFLKCGLLICVGRFQKYSLPVDRNIVWVDIHSYVGAIGGHFGDEFAVYHLDVGLDYGVAVGHLREDVAPVELFRWTEEEDAPFFVL